MFFQSSSSLSLTASLLARGGGIRPSLATRCNSIHSVVFRTKDLQPSFVLEQWSTTVVAWIEDDSNQNIKKFAPSSL
jgi:hypothetical protein